MTAANKMLQLVTAIETNVRKNCRILSENPNLRVKGTRDNESIPPLGSRGVAKTIYDRH